MYCCLRNKSVIASINRVTILIFANMCNSSYHALSQKCHPVALFCITIWLNLHAGGRLSPVSEDFVSEQVVPCSGQPWNARHPDSVHFPNRMFGEVRRSARHEDMGGSEWMLRCSTDRCACWSKGATFLWSFVWQTALVHDKQKCWQRQIHFICQSLSLANTLVLFKRPQGSQSNIFYDWNQIHNLRNERQAKSLTRFVFTVCTISLPSC